MPSVAPSPTPQGGDAITTVLGERYSLTTRIAVGGMGEVWAAIDTVLGRQVAIKILRDDLVDSSVFLERFRAEARHTAALAHPGIARVFDYGEDRHGGVCVAYLVMELVPGQPLSKVMADRGALPVNMVLSLLAQTAEALHAAHVLGVVHRDVKPGNLLLLDNGTIKVTDFGIARAADSVSVTEVGQIIGTARYISPEQASGAAATPASDVYSLGVIGYEMLAGHPPFTADNVGALAMAHVHQPPPPLPLTVPAAVQAAIAEALSKDPADRPDDAHAFADKLRRLQLTTMPPPGTPADVAADIGEPTLVATVDEMGGSRTAIMPKGSIVVSALDLGMSGQPYSSRRQRRWIALAALAAFIVVVGLAQLRGAGGQEPLGGTTTTTPIVASITVDPNAVIGLPSAQASDLLFKAGLLVAINPVDAPGVAADVVTGVEPSGQVPSGATVTLNVSNGEIASTTTTAGDDNGKDNGKGKGKPGD
jgi:eukaryotic-like serine/threonine-protein kinase